VGVLAAVLSEAGGIAADIAGVFNPLVESGVEQANQARPRLKQPGDGGV